jgi:hypothetical protein
MICLLYEGGQHGIRGEFWSGTHARMKQMKDNIKMCPREADGLEGRWFVSSSQYCWVTGFNITGVAVLGSAGSKLAHNAFCTCVSYLC